MSTDVLIENSILTLMCLCVGIVIVGVPFLILKEIFTKPKPSNETPHEWTREELEREREGELWIEEQRQKEKNEERDREWSRKWDEENRRDPPHIDL
jgi:hypothetical protein